MGVPVTSQTDPFSVVLIFKNPGERSAAFENLVVSSSTPQTKMGKRGEKRVECKGDKPQRHVKLDARKLGPPSSVGDGGAARIGPRRRRRGSLVVGVPSSPRPRRLQMLWRLALGGGRLLLCFQKYQGRGLRLEVALLRLDH